MSLTSLRDQRLLLLAALLVVPGAVVTLISLLMGHNPRPEFGRNKPLIGIAAVPEQEAHATDGHESSAAQPEAIRAHKAFVAKQRLQALTDHVTAAQDAIAELGNEQTLWEEQVQPLLNNEEGAKIASDPGSVDRFATVHAALSDAEIPAAEHFSRRLGAIEGELKRLGRQEVPTVTAVLDRHVTEVCRLVTREAGANATRYRRDREAIQAILRRCRRNPRSSQTLAAACNRRREDVVQNIREESQRARDKSRRDHERRVQELKTEKLVWEQWQRETAQARATLCEKAKGPLVRARFKPLLTPGGRFATGNRSSRIKRPYSLSDLQTSGALDPTESGLSSFINLMTKSRDRGRVPFGGTAHERRRMRALQTEFVSLLDCFVEQGLILPNP